MLSCFRPGEKFREDDIIIALMGPSGVGKSRFVDLLDSGVNQRAGDGSMKSKTVKIKAVRVKRPIGNGQFDDRIVLIDTPGFNVKGQSDQRILKDIRNLLNKSNNGVELRGILCLHRIIDKRIYYNKTGSEFKELVHACGHSTAGVRVMLVTTHWPQLRDDLMPSCETREQELKQRCWKGTSAERLSEDPSDAWRIVNEVIAPSNSSS